MNVFLTSRSMLLMCHISNVLQLSYMCHIRKVLLTVIIHSMCHILRIY